MNSFAFIEGGANEGWAGGPTAAAWFGDEGLMMFRGRAGLRVAGLLPALNPG